MLTRLKVSNLAVIEKADMTFSSGLCVLTGETGSGKSVLMGALGLVLGARADASVVREGAVEAEVEAVFEDAQGRTKAFRRTVTREGKSRAWIDDESVSISELKEAGASLVDIHGSRANQSLLDDAFALKTLDAFGSLDLQAYRAAYETWESLVAQRRALSSAATEDLDFLRFQVSELEEAALSDEDETLPERHAAAAHAQEIVEEANEVSETLDSDSGVLSLLASLRPRFTRMARHFPKADEWAKEGEEISLRVEELSRDIAQTLSRFDAGEDDLSALDARLTVVNRLVRKYAPTVSEGKIAALLKILAEKKAKLEAADHREETLAKLEKEIAAAHETLGAAGRALSVERKRVAKTLEKKMTAALRHLGFLKSSFSVVFEEATPSPTGLDRVVFYFEPNPGEKARPLARIASSGEMARVMLALKVVTLSEQDALSPATLVFDEIDANIGGETGLVVGEEMRRVARRKQVIAITHLPQSAVFAAHHVVVSKSVSHGRTRAEVREVAGEARVAEISRMLGGERITPVVQEHARELLALGAR